MYSIKAITDMENLKTHIDPVLQQLKDSLLSLDYDKAKPLLYWLNDWGGKFLLEEDSFVPENLIRYQRGMIVQAHLGFKIGSEQGGLHYSLVVENNNALRNPVIMVIPLRSLKDGELPENTDASEVFLGYDIFQDDIVNLKQKIERLEYAAQRVQEIERNDSKLRAIKINISKGTQRLQSLTKGTVAQVNQMCTLSKLRIYHAKYNGDELFSLRLDPKKLDDIDEKVSSLYLKPKK